MSGAREELTYAIELLSDEPRGVVLAARAVYEACGLVPHIDPGNYAHDWHLHRGEEGFIGWLERVGAREVQAPAPGDVALFRYGRAFSHGAVVVDSRHGTMVHSYVGRGVICSLASQEPLFGRTVQYWGLKVLGSIVCIDAVHVASTR